jgi:hypothetical protein
MSGLIRQTNALTSPTDMRSEVSRVKRKLLRTKAKCTALSLRSEWCKTLRQNAKTRNAVSIREVASGPNFVLLASLSLFGTALCWIIGDMMHWILGILFAVLGLCVSFLVVLRVTFNATLFSDEQLQNIQNAATGHLALLNADVARLDTELHRLQPLVDAEILYEREMKRLLAQKAVKEERLRQEAKIEEQRRSQFRRNGSPPTERQLRFAAHLQMKLTGNESKEELSLLIDRVLQKQTPEQEADSKRRWMQQEHRITRSELANATLREIEDALEVNREMGEVYVTGFVVVRGNECGARYDGKFVKIKNARNELHSMPPFDDCNLYKCHCEVIGVIKGETAREVFRQNKV